MVQLDFLKRCAIVDNVQIELTKFEYILLKHFLENPGIVFSREDLIKLHNRSVSLRSIDTAISRLRKKIGDKSIKSRIGFGYYYEEL